MSNSIDSVVDGALQRTAERRPAETSDNAAGKPEATGTGQAADLLNLTGRAKELQSIEQELTKTPEFDAARVSELKEAIASGNYEVNAERIADKLLALEAKLP